MKTQDIRIVGGQHHQFQEATDAGVLKPGVELFLVREPDNSYDRNAIKAFVRDSSREPDGPNVEWMIAYVSARDASRIAWRLDNGAVVHRCTVTKLDKKACTCALDLRGGWLTEAEKQEQEEEEFRDRTASKPSINPGDLDDDIPF